MSETLPPATAPYSPAATPPDALPTRVTVHEVGPRDGLQAESTPLGLETKIAFCRDLLSAGVSSLEFGSFVHPRWVPQMADSEAVIEALSPAEGVRLTGLIPNARGFARAQEAGVRSVASFASCTESFARNNMNMSREESLATAAQLAREAHDLGLHVRGCLSMCFGDPWEGDVDPQQVVDAALRLADAGADTVLISDTIGVAHARQVEDLLGRIIDAGVPTQTLAMHFHDTYGQGLANVLASLEAGVAEFDSSASGLGRCPFAPGATGNLATEDLVWMLHGMGYETGIDLGALMAASDWVDTQLDRSTASAVKRAATARP